jgi:hypothetical protein
MNEYFNFKSNKNIDCSDAMRYKSPELKDQNKGVFMKMLSVLFLFGISSVAEAGEIVCRKGLLSNTTVLLSDGNTDGVSARTDRLTRVRLTHKRKSYNFEKGEGDNFYSRPDNVSVLSFVNPARNTSAVISFSGIPKRGGRSRTETFKADFYFEHSPGKSEEFSLKCRFI